MDQALSSLSEPKVRASVNSFCSVPRAATQLGGTASTVSLAPQRWAGLSSPMSSSPTTTGSMPGPQRSATCFQHSSSGPNSSPEGAVPKSIETFDHGLPSGSLSASLRQITAVSRSQTTLGLSSPGIGMPSKQATLQILGQSEKLEAILKSNNSEHKLAVLHALAHLANCLIEEENFSEAERLVREALAVELQPTLLASHKTISFHRIECQETLAVILQRQRRFDEAELLYKSALQLRKEIKSPEDPATFCNLATIGITRACVHLAHGREILQETHVTRQTAKQARGTAEVVLREAKRLLLEARTNLRMAISLCGDGSSSGGSSGSSSNASPQTSAVVSSASGSSPPSVAATVPWNQEGISTTAASDNTLLLIGAKHNFIAVHNYLREIRFLRGKDRGDLNPRRVLSSMQSPLKAIRLGRTVSRYEKELKGSSTSLGSSPSVTNNASTPPGSKRGADQDFVDLSNANALASPLEMERRDTGLSEHSIPELSDYMNQMFHRRCTSGFDWYKCLEQATKHTPRENAAQASDSFSPLSSPRSNAISIPNSPPAAIEGGLDHFSFAETQPTAEDDDDFAVRMMSPSPLTSPRIRYGPGYTPGANYRNFAHSPTSPTSSTGASPAPSPRDPNPMLRRDSGAEQYYPYACSPPSLSVSPGGSGWASLVSPATSPHSYLSVLDHIGDLASFDDVSLESDSSAAGEPRENHVKASNILQLKTKQVVDRVVGKLTLIKTSTSGASTPQKSDRAGMTSSQPGLTHSPSLTSMPLRHSPSMTSLSSPSPSPSFGSLNTASVDVDLPSFDELIFSDDEDDDEPFRRQHQINFASVEL